MATGGVEVATGVVVVAFGSGVGVGSIVGGVGVGIGKI